jgi:hypothetical protein
LSGGPLERAPKPIAGVELTLADNLRILHETLTWTQRVGRGLALQALGPCYALRVVIEHPATEATELHGKLDETYRDLLRFITR